jgi:hypothetical protein
MSPIHRTRSRQQRNFTLASVAAALVAASLLLPPGCSCARVDSEAHWSSKGSTSKRGVLRLDEAQRDSLRAPSFVFKPSLTGSLGEKVNAALGGFPPDQPWPEDAAVVGVDGHLPGGGATCYLPLFKRETFEGFISLRAAYALQVPPEGPRIPSEADRQLSYTIERTSIGLSSCAAVEAAVVDDIVTHIRQASADMLAP